MPDRKISLNLSERITLVGVLPKENTLVNLRATKNLIDSCAFTDEEKKEYEIVDTQYPTGQVVTSWNKKGADYTKDMMFGEIAQEVIKKSLRDKESQGQLSINCLSLWDKFVEVKEEQTK